MSKQRRQRVRWFAEHPFCYFCKVRLTMPKYDKFQGARRPTDATVDHLRPRGDPARHEPNPFGIWRRVLACSACNHRRNVEFTRTALSLEEIWRSAGHWPRMAYQHGALPGEV